ncbi:MAG TPA: metallophosphoesterase [Polyangia bacterium]|nr:metallophosphoesterase [Polyangia bacterium]
MFRLAHVTDPHFRGFREIRPLDFASKRAVGLANLVVNRSRKHKMDLLEDLRRDLRAVAPDHLALTGDLSNVSINGEWRVALAWLDLCGLAPDAVTVIPGNHDAYVEQVVKDRTFEKLFASYQTSDVDRDPDTAYYPFVQVREQLALIGVSSAVATGDLGAWGEIGEAQLRRLEDLLRSPQLTSLMRVVLLHHPPVVHKGGEHRNLRDREALAAVLARAGADLVLHGHDHQDERGELPGPGGKAIPIVGGGSASYAGSLDRRARYNVFEIEGTTITWTTRVQDPATTFFREVRRERLV